MGPSIHALTAPSTHLRGDPPPLLAWSVCPCWSEQGHTYDCGSAILVYSATREGALEAGLRHGITERDADGSVLGRAEREVEGDALVGPLTGEGDDESDAERLRWLGWHLNDDRECSVCGEYFDEDDVCIDCDRCPDCRTDDGVPRVDGAICERCGCGGCDVGSPPEEEHEPRAPGCRCHLEAGDSPCPVHGEDEEESEPRGGAPWRG